jgi:hypothetical protein
MTLVIDQDMTNATCSGIVFPLGYIQICFAAQ